MLARRLLFSLCIVIIIAALVGLTISAVPVTAQISPFATNTPRPESQPAATPAPSATLNLPDAPFERYALRLWTEGDMLALLEDVVTNYRVADADTSLAIALLQGEIARRFPQAPRSTEQRDRILFAMLNAPRGQVDPRRYVYGYIADALTAENPIFNATYTFERAGFRYTLTAVNLNGTGAIDALVHVVYPASASDPDAVLFDTYVAAEPNPTGAWRVLPAVPSYPAAPLGNIRQITLERAADLTGDGIAELAIAIDDGSLNRRLELFSWRTDALTEVTQPGEELRFGLITALESGTPVTVQVDREESRRWGCISRQQQGWAWALNAFRREPPAAGYIDQNTLGCAIHRLEPIFAAPVSQARAAIESLLITFPMIDPAVPRASVALAMLTALAGDISGASTQMQTVRSAYPDDPWVQRQTNAFLRAASRMEITPLQLCGALEEAGVEGDGMCDVDAVLERILTTSPPLRALPLDEQLETYGLTAVDQFTVTQAGLLPREVLRLRVNGFGAADHWWAFAPLQADSYVASRAEPPAASVPVIPITSVLPPENAYILLIDNNDPRAAISVIDTTVRAATNTNPFVPISPSLRYMRALAYDLLNERVISREEYFQIWTSSPGTIWGQLAAAHLERR